MIEHNQDSVLTRYLQLAAVMNDKVIIQYHPRCMQAYKAVYKKNITAQKLEEMDVSNESNSNDAKKNQHMLTCRML